jgi:hypothetical protein
MKPASAYRIAELQEKCRILEDSTVPGEPPYGSTLRLASHWPTFTGYDNSTPIPDWTEERRLAYWRRMQAIAKGKLKKAMNSPTPSRAKKAGKHGYFPRNGAYVFAKRLLQERPGEWISKEELFPHIPNISKTYPCFRKYCIKYNFQIESKLAARINGQLPRLTHLRLLPSLPAPSTTEGEGNLPKQGEGNDCINHDHQSGTNQQQSAGESCEVL